MKSENSTEGSPMASTPVRTPRPKDRPGRQTTEYFLTWAIPMAGTVGAGILGALGQLPEWAQDKDVLVAAIAATAFGTGCYVISRGLAKR